MREIKFRAWDKEGKKMWYPSAVASDGRNIALINHFGVEAEDLQRDTIMQFTGVKDKNGKEIYEGDIIKYSFLTTSKVIIVFGNIDIEDNEGYSSNLCIGFYVKNIDKKRHYWDIRHPDCLDKEYDPEVIGNIYENPELLEDKHD